LVVHGADGLDEITTTGETYVAELHDGQVSCYTISPEQFGLPRVSLTALAGGDAPHNAHLTQAILQGHKGAPRDVVLLNAAAGLVVADAAPHLEAGLELAARSIDSGAALHKLHRLQRFTP
jgi:anthranilate phosphoribosyltransferase